MKQISLLTAFVILGLLSFEQHEKIINDKNAQTRDIKGFHAINVSGGIDLYISQGNEAVAVSAGDLQDRERIKTEVVDGVLKIYMESVNGIHWNIGSRKLKAYISFKTLDNLKASGGSDIFTEDVVKLEKLDIHLSGGSDLKGGVSIGNLSITQSGGSDVHINGTVTNLQVEASGGSDLHGFGLVTDMCHINASGGSDARITVNKELTAVASGGSDIYYKGPGVVKEMKSSGSSNISKKG